LQSKTARRQAEISKEAEANETASKKKGKKSEAEDNKVCL